MGRRLSAAAACGALAAVLLGACTGGSPDDGSSASASPSSSGAPATEDPATRTSATADPLTVAPEATDVDASLRVSRELFDESPVVVVAPAGQPDTQRLAAHASVSLGVPLLVVPPASDAAGGEALASELARLAPATVVAVGDFTGLPEPAGEDQEDDAPAVVRAGTTPSALAEATGVVLDGVAPADPATFATEVAGLAPAAAPAPSRSTDLPTFARAAPLDGVLALAVDAPEHLAAIATARAAGVPVHLVPPSAPNPQAHPGLVDALHASAGARVLAVGAALAAEPALDWKVRAAQTGVQLPGGGQLLFPRHQFVALYGTPATTSLGVLGEQDAPASVQRARETAAAYVPLTDRTVVPMFEIIATVAAGSEGADGNFSNEQSVDTLRTWVDEAAAAGIYVVLDLQPGRSDFLTQARQYEELLARPNVGLALDPEWRLGPDERPLQRIGSVDAAEVNAVVTWLAELTNRHALPQKMLVLHQFQLRMLADRALIDTTRPELAVVIHADGQGGQPAKQSTWQTLRQGAPAGVAWGWKNFHDEDTPMLTPEQTMRDVVPAPDLVTYQ